MAWLKKAVAFLGLILLCNSSRAQDADPVSGIAQNMAAVNVFEMSYSVGYSGALSRQFLLFERLVSIATDQQLLDLAAGYPNAVVRLYAYNALRRKKITIPERLAQQLSSDKEQVTYLWGCEGGKRKVNDLMHAEVFPLTLDKQP